MRKLLFYIPDIDQTFGGILQYAANLLNTFGQLDDLGLEILVYHNVSDQIILEVVQQYAHLELINDDLVYSRKNVMRAKLDTRKVYLYNFLVGGDGFGRTPKSELELFIESQQIDIVYCPYQDFPIRSKKVKKVSTLHDIQEVHFPEFFSPQQRAYRARKYLEIVNKAEQIVVSYNHIAKDLIKYFNADKNKLNVLLLNMGNLWFVKYQNESVDRTRAERRYLLYPANFWPHKNQLTLLKAFRKLIEEIGGNIQLVFTGNFETAYGKEIQDLVKRWGLENEVIFEGIVEERKLFELYQDCAGVVVPTRYEAGSFPLMEAILMEIPVIASNVTSLPETLDNDKFLFDPENPNDLTKKMKMLVEDPEYRAASIANSRRVSARLRNTGCETVLRDLISKLK